MKREIITIIKHCGAYERINECAYKLQKKNNIHNQLKLNHAQFSNLVVIIMI